MDNAMAMKAEVLDGDSHNSGAWPEAACAALYQEQAPRLFRLAYWALLGDGETAAAVVSRAFARCLGVAAAGEPAERVRRRLEGMSVQALRESLPEPGGDGGGEAAGIAVLRPEQRLTFLLHDGSGYPLERCAELLDLEPQACRQLLFAARLRLCQGGGVWRRTPAA